MPYYRFNSFTGRLTESINLQPLHPLAPKPFQSSLETTMVYDSVNTKPASTSPIPDGKSRFSPEVLKKMELYQKNIHKPVYLAGGKPDVYIATIAVVFVSASFIHAIGYLISKSR